MKKGIITGYSNQRNIGFIKDDAGRSYLFTPQNCSEIHLPQPGQHIIFEEKNHRVTELKNSPKVDDYSNSKILNLQFISALLAFIIGFLGAHKFYLGLNKSGAITLGLFIVGLISHNMIIFVVFLGSWFDGFCFALISPKNFKEQFLLLPSSTIS